MTKMLQSEWTASALGAILYFLVLALSWHPPPALKETTEAGARVNGNLLSFDPLNPEVEQLMEELRAKKVDLDKREAQLAELATRLQSEREQMDAVTQKVYLIQQRFDSSLLKIREAENANLKKLAKTYLSMTPDSASQSFKSMDDDLVAKILRNMKETDAAAYLDALAKLGPDGSKRTTRIVERMRVAVPESAVPGATNSAAPKTP